MALENIIIRVYQLKDYDQVKQNLMEVEMYDEDIYSEKRIKEKIEKDNKSIFIAEVDGKVIGNIFINLDWAVIIFGLCVKKDFRNQGIGKKLVDAAVAEVKNKGYKSINLLVRENRTELQNTYERWGFIKDDIYRWMRREIK